MSDSVINFPYVTDLEKWSEKVERVEAIGLNMPQMDMPVTHEFLPGMYRRGVTIPKGTFAIGHAHRDRCFDFVMSGRGTVITNGVMRNVTAPAVMVSEPMMRKVGVVIEEMNWFTVHRTDETDLDKLEDQLLVKSQAFLRYEAAGRKEKIEADRSDYRAALADLGVTHDQVLLRTKCLHDLTATVSEEEPGVFFARSRIDGAGMFAMHNFTIGQLIATALIGGLRTPAGRYCNHSATPNAVAQREASGNISLIAKTFIHLGTEVTLDYRQTQAVAQNI